VKAVDVRRNDWLEVVGTVSSVMARSRAGNVVVFTYEVDGHFYGGSLTTYDPYEEGASIIVRHDPDDPERNDLIRRQTTKNWVAAGILVLLAIWFIVLKLRH
jgi:hypothetical protein